MNSYNAPSRVANISAWVLQVIAAAFFLMAAYAKISGMPELISLFNTIGLGQWFRYFTAAVEIVGAIMLLLPRTVAYGAILLLITMFGAIIAHLFVLKTSPAMAVIAIGVVGVILWIRRHTLPFN